MHSSETALSGDLCADEQLSWDSTTARISYYYLANRSASGLRILSCYLLHLCCSINIVQCFLQDIPIVLCNKYIKQYMSLTHLICALL